MILENTRDLYATRQTLVSEATQFFECLFPSGIPVGMKLLIWQRQIRYSSWFSDLTAASEFAIEVSRTTDVYFGAGLRSEGLSERRTGGSDDVLAIPAFWADLDAGDKSNGKNYPPTIEDIYEVLNDLPHAPTVMLKSGSGIHAWWKFDRLWLFNSQEDRSDAQQQLRSWSRMLQFSARKWGWQFDSSSALNKLMRIPGTLNHGACPDH